MKTSKYLISCLAFIIITGLDTVSAPALATQMPGFTCCGNFNGRTAEGTQISKDGITGTDAFWPWEKKKKNKQKHKKAKGKTKHKPFKHKYKRKRHKKQGSNHVRIGA